MSESDKKELELPNLTAGLTMQELEEIKAYREAGMPGLIEVTDQKLISAYDMRLEGHSYLDIGRALKLSRLTVLHLAEKYDWHQKRIQYLDDYERHLKDRIVEEKIHNKYFMMKALHVFRKKMGKRFDKYLATGDDTIWATIDPKEISVFLKMAKDLDDLDANSIVREPNGTPAIGLNMPDGFTVKKLADNTVEVTPKTKSHKEMLAELAKSRGNNKKD